MENKRLMLIADDEEINRILLRQQFSEGYEFIEAENGAEALELMQKYAARLDIVLLDIYMPVMDGFSVLKEMQKSEPLRGYPVIAITGDETAETEALRLGAWDFIHKLSAPEVLKIRIENVIRRRNYMRSAAERVKTETRSGVFHYLNDMPPAFIAVKYTPNGIAVDYCNRNYLKICGQRDCAPGTSAAEYLAFGQEGFGDILSEFAVSGDISKTKLADYEKDGRTYSAYFYIPHLGSCVCLLNDVTNVKDIQRKSIEALERENKLLQEQNRQNLRYEIITSQTGAVVFENDFISGTSYVSENIKEYRFKHDIFLPDGTTNVNAVIPADRTKFIREFKLRAGEQQETAETTVRVELADNSYMWCKFTARFSYSENGKLSRVIGTVQNVTNEHEYLDKLRHRAEYDITTEIYNKRTFFLRTKNLLDLNKHEQFCIIRFDVDNFKVINELFGHDEGDKLLRHIASDLESLMSSFGDCTYGRLESDVFCVCLKKRDADDAVEKIGLFAKDYMLDFDIMISIGIYEVTDHSLSVDVMCDRAHLAQKTIKGNYIRRSAYFDEKMHESIINDQMITSMMNTALAEKQFIVYYQPKYNISTGAISGAEALVRWIHPEKGMIYPGMFIPVFERNGFIMKLDEYVWEEVCIFIRRSLDAGKRVLPISVNISKVNLYNPKLCETIIGLVEKYNIPTPLFQLELTESAFTDNKFVLDNVMKQLKAYGFTVMMDDFGSGYSSLNMLKEIPVDVLKIDLRFLSGEGDSIKGGKILSSVITMAKWLDMHVITEGIETVEQLSFLRSVGCEDGQGFYFARPIPEADYAALVEGASVPNGAKHSEAKPINMEELWDPNSALNIMFDNIICAAGFFEYNGSSIKPVRLNDRFFEVTGISRSSFNSNREFSFSFASDSDYRTVYDLFRRALNSRSNEYKDFEFATPDGAQKKIRLTARCASGSENSALFFVTLNDTAV